MHQDTQEFQFINRFDHGAHLAMLVGGQLVACSWLDAIAWPVLQETPLAASRRDAPHDFGVPANKRKLQIFPRTVHA